MSVFLPTLSLYSLIKALPPRYPYVTCLMQCYFLDLFFHLWSIYIFDLTSEVHEICVFLWRYTQKIAKFLNVRYLKD
jgi:hypothetical protein